MNAVNDAGMTTITLTRTKTPRGYRYTADGMTWRRYTLGSDVPIPDQCSICHADIWDGWLCPDLDEAICTEHVKTRNLFT